MKRKERSDNNINIREQRSKSHLQEASGHEQVRSLAKWLLFVPSIMVILLACGQLALLTSTANAFEDAPSNLSAEYSPWSFTPIRPVLNTIVEEIRRDHEALVDLRETFYDPIEESGYAFIENETTVVIAALPDSEGPPPPLPTFTANSSGEGTSLPAGQSTPVPGLGTEAIPTSTGLVFPTETPSPTSPTATGSATEAPSATLTQATPTVGSTPTSTPTQSNDFAILWLSSEHVGSLYKLVGVKPNGSEAQIANEVLFAIGEIPTGTNILSGSATIHFYAANASDADASIYFELGASSGTLVALGESTIMIPGNAPSPVLFSITFPTIAYQYAQQGEIRLTVRLHAPVYIHWDGVWNNTRIILPPVSP